MKEPEEKSDEPRELTIREMDKATALDLLTRIKARALEAADKGAEWQREREREREDERRREEARRKFLRRQVAELLEEGE